MNLVGTALVATAVLLTPFARDTQLDRLDRRLGSQRSLLAFLPDDVTEGRFAMRLHRAGYGHEDPRITGELWRTPSGNVYTRVAPYDAARVATAVAGVRARIQSDDDARYRVGLVAEPYDGSEFQFGLSDLLVERGVAGAGVNELLRSWRADCDRAVTRHEANVRAVVDGLEPRFTRHGAVDSWSIDLRGLVDRTRATRTAAERTCQAEVGYRTYQPDGPAPAILVERGPTDVAVRIRSVDGGSGVYRTTTLVTIHVVPGHVGPPPALPQPAPGFTDVSLFLLRVDECGALPWEYTNFAAANSYTRPVSERYIGPNPFATEFVCERDVEPGDREHALDLEETLG